MNYRGYTGIVAVNLCVCTSVRKHWERAFGIRMTSGYAMDKGLVIIHALIICNQHVLFGNGIT